MAFGLSTGAEKLASAGFFLARSSGAVANDILRDRTEPTRDSRADKTRKARLACRLAARQKNRSKPARFSRTIRLTEGDKRGDIPRNLSHVRGDGAPT